MQLVEFPAGDGLEVALGGGRSNFLPATAADPEDADQVGLRADGRDLAAQWAGRDGAEYIWNRAQFDAIDTHSTDHLLGLFERSHMEYEADRADDSAGEPSLAEMTTKAIDILERNEKGYFLMVEGGRIDHAHHAGNASRALHDTLALAEAVGAALDKTTREDTLILVTADHSHVFTIGGYPSRGNDILGKVIGNDATGARATEFMLDDNGLPYTTLTYANGPGYRGGERPDLSEVDTGAIDFLQEATVPLTAETHAAPTWRELNAVLPTDPRAMGLRHTGTQRLFGQPAKSYTGRRAGQVISLIWLERDRLPYRLVVRHNRRTTQVRMRSLVPGATPLRGPGDLRGYRRLDGADLGDLESDPFVQQNDQRLNVHAHR